MRSNLELHVLGEQIGKARDRATGSAGVKRGKNQVTGFRRGQRHLSRVAIADFTDEDHVGILPQTILQSVSKRLAVEPHLALRHDRTVFRGIPVLHRFFDRDNSIVAFRVEQVHDHGQRRCFAGAGHTGDQHQAIPEMSQPVRQITRESSPVKVRNAGGDQPNACADFIGRDEKIHPKPMKLRFDRHLQREIQILILLESGEEPFGCGGGQKRSQIGVRQHGLIQFLKLTVAPQNGPMSGHQVQVGRSLLNGLCQPSLQQLWTVILTADRIGAVGRIGFT